MARPPPPPDELSAPVEARRELGREREPEVIDAFLERVEREIDARVDERLATRRLPARRHGGDWAGAFLSFMSLGIGIGATGAATGTGHSWVAVAAWLAIVLVN